ncbi:MAG: tetratricopeptide repeat protein, partial [Thermoanaerobaculia bacterium]
FFVNEIVRLLVADGRLEHPGEVKSWSVTIPQGVREVVGRRLDRLSEECNRVLTVASVIGREFGLDALQRVSDLTGDGLLEVLEEAVAARVAAEVPRALGRYSFSHALIRETLYEELTTTRRVRLHRRIAEVLEALHQANPEPHLAELAYHFFQGAQGGGDVERAIDYSIRAGERATQQHAYEEAIRHYERALQALELKEPDDAQHSDLLLTLGGAQWRAGEFADAKATFLKAANVAKEAGLLRQLADAALGYGGRFAGFEAGAVDDALIGLLESALSGLDEGDSALRARVIARLAEAITFSGSQERRITLGQEAIEMARRVGDPEVLMYVLNRAHWALWTPDNDRERLALSTETSRLADETGDEAMALESQMWRYWDLLELGEISASDPGFDAVLRQVGELRQPYHLWLAGLFRAMLALLEGRFEEAEQLEQNALEIGQRAQNQNAVQLYGAGIVVIRREQGRLAEMEPAVAGMVQQYPAIRAWQCSLAWLHSDLERRTEAQSALDAVAEEGFDALPRDLFWITAMALLSEACAFLGDGEKAPALYDLLAPYADRCVVFFSGSFGSVARNLGLLAATMQRWEDAERHFEDALDMNARMGARPWVARTQHDYADMLLRRGEPGDREKALELLTQTLDTAQELGMKALVERSLALKLQAYGIDPSAPQTSIDAVAASVYVDKPDLPPAAVAPDGTVTILFTDIEGSTAMTERLGDQRWLELLREHNAIVREQVAAQEGFEVKAEGDGFMLAFGSARRALQCA